MTNLDEKLRQASGTAECMRLREEGLVPGIIYGGGGENVSISLVAKQVNLLVKKGLANVTLQGELNEQVTLQDVQYDGLGSTVMHVDFLRGKA